MEKLKIAPLTRAKITVYFTNNLRIFENKVEYYEKIKNDFPQIIYPEQKNLKYSMGDIGFFSANFGKNIAINTNYFRLGDSAYDHFNVFRGDFRRYFKDFCNIYKIEQFSSFYMEYNNLITMTKEIGLNINDYFTMNFDFKGKKKKDIIGIFGSFAFKTNDGLLSIDMKPGQPEKDTIDQYRMIINFNSQFADPVPEELLFSTIDKAHEYIDDVFENSLTTNYLKTLK